MRQVCAYCVTFAFRYHNALQAVDEQTVRHTQMLRQIDETHTTQQLLKGRIACKARLNELIFIIPSWNAFLYKSSRTENCSSLSSMLRLVVELQRQHVTSSCLNCMPARSTGRQPSALWPMKGSHCFADVSSLTNCMFLAFNNHGWLSVAQGSRGKRWRAARCCHSARPTQCVLSKNDAASIGL